ncbi:MAG: pyridoxal phosphate-dependent decarboxylase family protein [Thermoanaerobaculaceae bacterium]
MSVSPPGEDWDQLLALAGRWVRDYRNRIGALPVLARVEPGWLLRQLPKAPPEKGEPPERWFEDLERLIEPAVTHWNHPGFLGYFGITGSPPGVVAEFVAAALNVNGMLWKTCPALTELEQVVTGWYGQALGLPETWFGMITDTASTSTLLALGAARERALPEVREKGLRGRPQLRLYCSQEAHSSVDKAALVLGIGRENVVRVGTDEAFRMRVELLEEAVVRDLQAGYKPFAVVATVGTTSSTSVDPVREIAQICRKYGLWLHVDAAYAGSAAVAPEFRWALDGCELADSFVANPHKWLFTPIDCSCLFTAHAEAFQQAYALHPAYLTTDTSGVPDLMDYGFQLGRRFRALKLWFVFRAFGRQGLAEQIRRHVDLARLFGKWVAASRDFELLAPIPFSVVNFRWHPLGMDSEDLLEAANRRLLEMVNGKGRVFLSHTVLGGRFALHLAVGNLYTDQQTLSAAWEDLQELKELISYT